MANGFLSSPAPALGCGGKMIIPYQNLLRFGWKNPRSRTTVVQHEKGFTIPSPGLDLGPLGFEFFDGNRFHKKNIQKENEKVY
jgi:hypothetical protein